MYLFSKFFISICLILLFASSSWAATYYVRTDGANANWPCTVNTAGGACRDIDYAADHVVAGDTVRVQAGPYSEMVTPGVEGTAGLPITFVADGAVTICGFTFPSNADYIRIIGFTMNGSASGCSTATNGVSFAGVNTYLEFWNNTIYNLRCGICSTGGWPSATNYASNILIIGNEMYNMRYAGSGLAVSVPLVDSFVSYNTIHDCYPDGFGIWGQNNRFLNNYSYSMLEDDGGHTDIWQTGSNYLGLRNSLFEAHFQLGTGTLGDEHAFQISHHNPETCVGSCGSMTENIFRRNVFHNVGEGVGGVNQTDGGAISYTRVYHNTTAESCENAVNASTDFGWTFYGAGTSDTYIFNNLEYEVWGNSESSSVDVYYVEGGLTCDYNLAYDPDGNVTFASPWTGQANAQSNVNPNLVDYANHNFTLGAGSGDGQNARGTGGPLATTSGAGTGTTFNVATGRGGFFRGDNTNISQYSGNLVVGDTITVGTDVVTVVSISGDAITVAETFTWANGEPVFFGNDTTPDIGAYPYKAGGYALTATYLNSGGNITVTPNDASLVRFVVCFDDGIPTTVDNASPYICTVAGTPTVRVYSLYASTTPVITADYDDGNIGKSVTGCSSQGSIR